MTNKILSKIKSQPSFYLISCLIIILLTFVIYGQTLGFGLIDYDDPIYISNNTHLQAGFTYSNFVWSITYFLNSNWAPVTIWSYIVDASIYGDWYGGYHLTNVILHGINGILLFFVALKLSHRQVLSLLLAVLFIVHPQHVESVAWLSQRKDLLSALFMFLSILWYVIYKTKNIRHYYLLSIGAFIIGLMAKVIIAPLPILLILIDYVFFLDNQEKRSINSILKSISKITPYFIAAIVFGGINYYAQINSGALGSSYSLPADIRISNIPLAYWFYPLKAFLPLNLIPYYPYPSQAPILLSIAAFVALIIVTVLAFLFRDKYRFIFFGWFFYLIFATPMTGIFQTGMHAYADRYSYIANIGLLIILIVGLVKLSEFISSNMVKVFVIVSILIFTVLSYKQAALWKDTYTLFSYTLNVSPGNHVAYMKVAKELAVNNNEIEAEKYIKQAIKTNPLEAHVYSFAARFYHINNKPEKARQLLEKALKLDIWRKGIVYREMAQYHILQGDYDTAIELLNIAIEYKHEIAASYLVRGLTYRMNGNHVEAIKDIQQAISINQQYTKAYIVMGNTLMNIGQVEKALPYYIEALRQNPSNIRIRKIVEQLTEAG